MSRGTPLWPLCVSADRGRGGALAGGGGRGGGRVGLGLEGLDCSDDDNECNGFLSFFASL